jgi:hypothetical protein
MRCKKCGASVGRKAKFCRNCGAPIKKASKQIYVGVGVTAVMLVVVLSVVWFLSHRDVDLPASAMVASAISQNSEDTESNSTTTLAPVSVTEAELKALLSNATSDEIVSWIYDDFDGNGTCEAYALTYPSNEANVWFISSNGAELIMNAGNAGWYSDTPLVAGNHKFMVLIQYEPVPTMYYAKHFLFTVNNEESYQPTISGEDGYFGNNSQECYDQLAKDQSGYETPVTDAFYSCTWRAYGADPAGRVPWENIVYYDFDENSLEFIPWDENLYASRAQTLSTDMLIPPEATLYNGNYYLMVEDSLSWEDSEAACEAMGGHLAVITDADEEQYIESLIQSGERYFYWLGGTDEEKEGVWVWITGEAWLYTNWKENEPTNESGVDGSSENCLAIERDAEAWNDIQNVGDQSGNWSLASAGYICEWDDESAG